MLKTAKCICCVVALIGSLSHGEAAPARIETRTRLVALFSDLNHQLFDAIRSHDAAKLQTLVADDFELCYAASPDQPLTREDWVQQVDRRPPKSIRISHMSVRGWPEVAVVSFIQDDISSSRSRVFVVQAWGRNNDAWILQQEYISRTPVSSAVASRKDKKPTGKD